MRLATETGSSPNQKYFLEKRKALAMVLASCGQRLLAAGRTHFFRPGAL